MRRMFWIALGATAGVLIVRKITQAADNFIPDGAADRVNGGVRNLTDAVREFTAEVKTGMAERDAELRQALGISGDVTGTGPRGEPDLAAVDDLFRTNPRGTD